MEGDGREGKPKRIAYIHVIAKCMYDPSSSRSHRFRHPDNVLFALYADFEGKKVQSARQALCLVNQCCFVYVSLIFVST